MASAQRALEEAYEYQAELENRIADLEEALEDCIGNLDAGYSDTPKIARRARAALKGNHADAE